MIPDKIQSLFDFIDFLHSNKEIYIVNYIPLVNELEVLADKRSELNPLNNYSKKEKYNLIQKEIEDKFPTITENVYKPFIQKLIELEIWSGDDTYSSIWNSNIEAISKFKDEFGSADIPIVMDYKKKYLSFRTETNSNFLCLQLMLQDLDEIFKELFDFFKDTEENEFQNFEAKKLKVNSVEDLVKSISENKTNNIRYSLPIESIIEKREQPSYNSNSLNFHNYETIMGDKIIAENIPNNSGVINVGKNNKSETNSNDELAIKTFNWQRFGIISAIILTVVGIIIAIIYS